MVTKIGQKLKLNVVAEVDNRDVLLPEIEAKIIGKGLKILTPKISYGQTFTGKAKIGEVQIVVNNKGEFNLEIDNDSVYTTLPDIDVISGKSRIKVD